MVRALTCPAGFVLDLDRSIGCAPGALYVLILINETKKRSNIEFSPIKGEFGVSDSRRSILLYRVAPIRTTVWQQRYWYGDRLKIECKKTRYSSKQYFMNASGRCCLAFCAGGSKNWYTRTLVRRNVCTDGDCSFSENPVSLIPGDLHLCIG